MPTQKLAKLVLEGQAIPTKSVANLFQELEHRDLSQDEHDIVRQRVLLNQKLFAVHQAQERVRKAAVISGMYPQLSKEGVQRALDACDGECGPHGSTFLCACNHS